MVVPSHSKNSQGVEIQDVGVVSKKMPASNLAHVNVTAPSYYGS